MPNNPRTECADCLPGWAGQNGFCHLCDPGYAPTEDVSECVACPYGKYMDNPSSLDELGRCGSCGPGFEPNSATGATSCSLCTAGKYSVDGVSCGPCGTQGEKVNQERSGCECKPGYFSYVNGRQCRRCPKGGVCYGGLVGMAVTLPAPGYWLDNTTLTLPEPILMACAPDTCAGADMEQSIACQRGDGGCCEVGHSKELCATCDEGWSKLSTGRCVPCKGGASGGAIFKLVVLMLAAGFILILMSKGPSQNPVLIAVFFMQTLSLVSQKWGFLTVIANLVNLNLDTSSSQCFAPLEVYHRFFLELSALPAIYAVGMLVGYWAWNRAVKNGYQYTIVDFIYRMSQGRVFDATLRNWSAVSLCHYRYATTNLALSHLWYMICLTNSFGPCTVFLCRSESS